MTQPLLTSVLNGVWMPDITAGKGMILLNRPSLKAFPWWKDRSSPVYLEKSVPRGCEMRSLCQLSQEDLTNVLAHSLGSVSE